MASTYIVNVDARRQNCTICFCIWISDYYYFIQECHYPLYDLVGNDTQSLTKCTLNAHPLVHIQNSSHICFCMFVVGVFPESQRVEGFPHPLQVKSLEIVLTYNDHYWLNVPATLISVYDTGFCTQPNQDILGYFLIKTKLELLAAV